jgi:hypothetical protein
MTLKKLLLTFCVLIYSLSSVAVEKRKFCVWDPVGANGPAMTQMKDFRITALKWGVDLDLQAYTDEKVASNDFKAGVCDAVFLTAIQAREFVPFAGSLDAIGAIPNEDDMKTVLKTLSSPKAEPLLTNGNYEVSAIFPLGSMYAFVTNKSINSISGFSGKKFSVLNNDPQMAGFANKVGGTVVPTTLATMSGQFNNGNLDVIFVPAMAYAPFELNQGMAKNGGILNDRLYYGFLEVVMFKDRFPADFGNNMRQYTYSRGDDFQKLADDAEKGIPKKYWIPVDETTKKALKNLTKSIRLTLKKEGKLDPKTLLFLWKVRCQLEPTRGECSTPE